MTPLRSTNGSTDCRRPRAGLDCRGLRQRTDHAAHKPVLGHPQTPSTLEFEATPSIEARVAVPCLVVARQNSQPLIDGSPMLAVAAASGDSYWLPSQADAVVIGHCCPHTTGPVSTSPGLRSLSSMTRANRSSRSKLHPPIARGTSPSSP